MLEAEVAKLGPVGAARVLAAGATAVAHAELAGQSAALAAGHLAVDDLAALGHRRGNLGSWLRGEQVAHRERLERRQTLHRRAVLRVTRGQRGRVGDLLWRGRAGWRRAE